MAKLPMPLIAILALGLTACPDRAVDWEEDPAVAPDTFPPADTVPPPDTLPLDTGEDRWTRDPPIDTEARVGDRPGAGTIHEEGDRLTPTFL